jgi:hypothetical protein
MQIVDVIVIALVIKELDSPILEHAERYLVRETRHIVVWETHVVDTRDVFVAACHNQLGLLVQKYIRIVCLIIVTPGNEIALHIKLNSLVSKPIVVTSTNHSLVEWGTVWKLKDVVGLLVFAHPH